MALPPTLHQPAVPYFTDPFTPKLFGILPVQSSFWRQAATAPDQLRQRLMFALSEIFVISVGDMNVITYPRGVASYMDTLAADSLGNYRQLLEGVALHPMMGLYLSHLGNRKEDPATGRVPDENYAREVMQLFTIGVEELNPDGSARTDADGRPIETYGNDDVIGLARVFTGWSWQRRRRPTSTSSPTTAIRPFAAAADPERDIRPMRFYPQHHSTSEKRFLGTTIPANTDAPTSLTIALDRAVRASERRPVHRPPADPAAGDQQSEPGLRRPRRRRLRQQRRRRARRHEGGGARDPARPGGARRSARRRARARQAARADAALHRLGARLQRELDLAAPGPIGSTADPATALGQSAAAVALGVQLLPPRLHAAEQRRSARAGLVAPEFQITNETIGGGLPQLSSAGRLLRHRLPATSTPTTPPSSPLADDPPALVDGSTCCSPPGSMSPTTQAR